MTEPAEIAPEVEHVAEGLWHWRIHNAAIGGSISSSHAVLVEEDGEPASCVLVDPIRLDPHALQSLPPVSAIVLTSRGHQRAAWRYREQLGAEVWLPEGTDATEEEPDHTYTTGDVLPGGLVAVHTPGPEDRHFSLHVPSRGAVIVSDLIQRGDDGVVEAIPGEYHEDAYQSQASIRELLELDFNVLLMDHGAPVVDDAHRALEAAVRD